MDDEVAELYARASRERLFLGGEPCALDAPAIEALLPHRPPLRLLDEVHTVQADPPAVFCSRFMDPADPTFRGHFPGHPVYPGVLLVETIGQAGILLHQLAFEGRDARAPIALTHIHAARFLHPVRPGDRLDVLATTIEDGLFFTVIGQVIVQGKVAAAAVVSAIL